MFLGFFIYHFKTSRKFRQSIIAALAAVIIFFSNVKTVHGTGEADAFTLQPQHLSRPGQRSGSGFFGGALGSDGSGPGKPDDSGSNSDNEGIPEYPKTDSVEETERHLANMDNHIRELDELTDSDSDTEQDQCQLKNIDEKFDSKAVQKLTKRALKNQRVKKEYEGIKQRLSEGANPIDIGKKSTNLPGNKVLIKGSHGRYLVENSGDQVNVLGIGARGDNQNIKTFEALMNKMYDLNLQY